MLREYTSTPEINERILRFINLRLLNLNDLNEEVEEEEFNTLEFTSTYSFFNLVYSLSLLFF